MEEFEGNMNEYLEEGILLLHQCKKAVVAMKSVTDNCSHRSVQWMVTKSTNKLNSITSGIYDYYNVKTPKNTGTLREEFRLLVDCNDTMLDKLADIMDEASGKKTSLNIDEITDQSARRNTANSASGQRVILTPRRIDKPQLSFAQRIDNSLRIPFIPILKEKPHSKKPLSILLCIDNSDREYYNHPYEYELMHFTTPQQQFKSITPINPMVFENTPMMMIDTMDDLNTAIGELSSCEAIAVDLEHHSFRTYLGLTCLLQISSRSKDYIIDTLKLRGSLDVLNEVFANPKIIKVFHGAYNDILWLQRDLGVYVINMFDTYQASILLEYPTKSLAYLLTKFCNVTTSKQYQRADWRIRPLPEDFIVYARKDTHYLLYIFDKMRNELVEKDNANLIYSVYDRSTSICLERYEKPYIDEDSHIGLYSRSRVIFNSRQRYALKKLFMWRDEIARNNDECVDYVMPAHMMLQISEHLPKEVQGILACCNPVPFHIKSYQLVLHHIVLEARKLPLEEVDSVLFYQKPEKPVHCYELKVDLISKFDFSHLETNPTGLLTILTDTFEVNASYRVNQSEDGKTIQKDQSDLFGKKFKIQRKPGSTNVCKFDTPFQRYQTIREQMDKSKNIVNITNEDRINGVLDYISQMNKSDVDTIEEEEPSEITSTEVIKPLPEVETDMPDLNPPQKRPLNRIIIENKWKEKHGNELPDYFDEIGMRKRQKNEADEIPEFKAFDYSQADTSFLRPPKKNKKDKIIEKYKAKRSQKPTGQKKSGLKSFSWGAKF